MGMVVVRKQDAFSNRHCLVVSIAMAVAFVTLSNTESTSSSGQLAFVSSVLKYAAIGFVVSKVTSALYGDTERFFPAENARANQPNADQIYARMATR